MRHTIEEKTKIRNIAKSQGYLTFLNFIQTNEKANKKEGL